MCTRIELRPFGGHVNPPLARRRAVERCRDTQHGLRRSNWNIELEIRWLGGPFRAAPSGLPHYFTPHHEIGVALNLVRQPPGLPQLCLFKSLGRTWVLPHEVFQAGSTLS